MAIQTQAVLAGNAFAVNSEASVTEARQLLRASIKAADAAADRVRELKNQLYDAERDKRIADTQVENVKTFVVESLVRIAESE